MLYVKAMQGHSASFLRNSSFVTGSRLSRPKMRFYNSGPLEGEEPREPHTHEHLNFNFDETTSVVPCRGWGMDYLVALILFQILLSKVSLEISIE
ncbi:hypothetical protein DIE23_37015 [Burkholderia sp. Bp9143]|nr:hypothetical protein DIE23_37015 [Burkholderia sp. Bp9143]